MSANYEPFDSRRGDEIPGEFPRLTGFVVFLETGPQQVAGLLRRFETTRCRILAIQTLPGHPAALLKIIVTHPDEARIVLERAGLPLADFSLIGVIVPDGTHPLLRVFLSLAQANVTILGSHLVPLPSRKRFVVLLEVDPIHRASEILLAHGFDPVSIEMLNEES